MNDRSILAALDKEAKESKMPIGNSNYTTEETRVHNKRIAPSGKIFLVVKVSAKFSKYTNCLAVPFGLTDEQKQKVYDGMYGQLVAKYGI